MASAFFPLTDEAHASVGRRGEGEARQDTAGPALVSLAIPEVKLLRAHRDPAERGFSVFSYRRLLADAGIDIDFVEDNRSVSVLPGSVRGLHFQDPPRAQARLVRVTRGSIFDVAVDIRSGSPTFGHYVSAILTASGGEQLFVPCGFAHGFCTLEADTEVAWTSSDRHSPEHESGIAFDDPDIGIDWPLDGREPIVSSRDRSLPTLRQLRSAHGPAVGEPSGARRPMRILVTGGAGFVGSAVIRHLIGRTGHAVLNLDKLTAAASDASLAAVSDEPRYELRIGDICDTRLLDNVFREFRPHAVVHLAAETATDRSVEQAEAFLKTNAIGTLRLAQAARAYLDDLGAPGRAEVRFQHVSTGEVFGLSPASDRPSARITPHVPLSPYSASKAAADHIVRAWSSTFGLPALVANCAEAFGPYQSPDELIPRTIIRAALGQTLPDTRRADAVRDWLYVEDLAEALVTLLERGHGGNTYLVGGIAQRSDRQVVTAIADMVDEIAGPLPDGRRRRELIVGAVDTFGDDYRFSLTDGSSFDEEIGWRPRRSFEAGLRATVAWYLENEGWWRSRLERGRPVGQRQRAVAAGFVDG